MLSQQHRIAIAAREIRLQRYQPLLWRQAQRIAELECISLDLAYTRLRCRQIERLVAVPQPHERIAANDAFMVTGVFQQAPEAVEDALKVRARRSMSDVIMALVGLGCIVLVWLHLAGRL
jgi:hypothetical protein